MKAIALIAWLGLASAVPGLCAEPADRPTVIVVVGAPGQEAYLHEFTQQADRWQQAAKQAGADYREIGRAEGAERSDREHLLELLAHEPQEGLGALWLVLIGHGTFDGQEAKFNLRGPDISAVELAAALQPWQRPLAVINTASASAPFLAALSGKNRVVVTATRSGHQQSFAHFGGFLAEVIADPASDLDQDGQTSLLEAFLGAARRVAEFYQTNGRLATEHALIDDNGDGLGTPADWFRGTRPTRRARDGATLDGPRAHRFTLLPSAAEQQLTPELRARRDQLETEIEALREKKATLGEEAYYDRLEILLLELARLYQFGEKT